MKLLRKLYFKLFKHYRRLELRVTSYESADRLMRQTADRPERERWVLAKEEDTNTLIGIFVWIERRERITE